MEPLELNREHLAFFSARISLCDRPRRIRFYRHIGLALIYLLQISPCFSSTIFIVKNIKTDPFSALYAIYQLDAVAISLISMAITSAFPESVCCYFEKFHNIRLNGKFRMT